MWTRQLLLREATYRDEFTNSELVMNREASFIVMCMFWKVVDSITMVSASEVVLRKCTEWAVVVCFPLLVFGSDFSLKEVLNFAIWPCSVFAWEVVSSLLLFSSLMSWVRRTVSPSWILSITVCTWLQGCSLLPHCCSSFAMFGLFLKKATYHSFWSLPVITGICLFELFLIFIVGIFCAEILFCGDFLAFVFLSSSDIFFFFMFAPVCVALCTEKFLASPLPDVCVLVEGKWILPPLFFGSSASCSINGLSGKTLWRYKAVIVVRNIQQGNIILDHPPPAHPEKKQQNVQKRKKNGLLLSETEFQLLIQFFLVIVRKLYWNEIMWLLIHYRQSNKVKFHQSHLGDSDLFVFSVLVLFWFRSIVSLTCWIVAQEQKTIIVRTKNLNLSVLFESNEQNFSFMLPALATQVQLWSFKEWPNIDQTVQMLNTVLAARVNTCSVPSIRLAVFWYQQFTLNCNLAASSVTNRWFTPHTPARIKVTPASVCPTHLETTDCSRSTSRLVKNTLFSYLFHVHNEAILMVRRQQSGEQQTTL